MRQAVAVLSTLLLCTAAGCGLGQPERSGLPRIEITSWTPISCVLSPPGDPNSDIPFNCTGTVGAQISDFEPGARFATVEASLYSYQHGPGGLGVGLHGFISGFDGNGGVNLTMVLEGVMPRVSKCQSGSDPGGWVQIEANLDIGDGTTGQYSDTRKPAEVSVSCG